eukprot:3578132-Rhodomonas_salina.2
MTRRIVEWYKQPGNTDLCKTQYGKSTGAPCLLREKRRLMSDLIKTKLKTVKIWPGSDRSPGFNLNDLATTRKYTSPDFDMEHRAEVSAEDKKRKGEQLLKALRLADEEKAEGGGGEKAGGEAMDLIREGADVTAKDNHGDTPLHWASGGGHDGVVRLLLEHGAHADMPNDESETPLHKASGMGYEGAGRMLLEHGADVNAKNTWGYTPLHCASLYGHEGAARMLLEHRADPNAKNDSGSTPLHWASGESGHEGITRMLLEHGAHVNLKDQYGQTTMKIASDKGRTKVVELLEAKCGQMD